MLAMSFSILPSWDVRYNLKVISLTTFLGDMVDDVEAQKQEMAIIRFYIDLVADMSCIRPCSCT